MIILIGLLIVVIVVGSVQLTFKALDYIETKFHKELDSQIYVILVLIVECLIALQILYNMKLIN